ncbi:papain-like cysteine protease family protein [Actinokineospora sp. NBRC 105648]|uniref:papain-like cysteine protease family protein n=1 Tax=Actinokineospora sp. NBRC 105648 TaxID=3032206 RepID=UPI0024A3010C|nr:papain-like cysteine protease family protein [Actinokineospora sp. NBRC 105648]GLZ40778.1 hypothetical protein Acsp05_44020 [Actinokineospora sp. NBRC 105648]
MKITPVTLRGLAVACAVASALVAAPAAQAAPASAAQAVSATGIDLNITMQEQQKSNWCWDASGNTIAAWFGNTLTQTKFCQIAHNETGTTCANNQGYLSDQQRVFRWLGFDDDGIYNSNGQTLSFSAIKTEIDNKRPIGTRIQWSNGGGHMHVLYGYDNATSGQRVSYGDPLQGVQRYHHVSYSAYKSNSEFSWTHTLYGIKG